MKRKKNCPAVRMIPDKRTSYDQIAAMLTVFQKYGCVSLGSAASETPH